VRDVHAKRRAGRLGRPLAPKLLDEAVRRDDLVRAKKQRGEQRPLPRPAETDRARAANGLDRAEDPELDPAARSKKR
jgi:hypothetical protein